jgi:hypothetical protein
MPLLNPDHDPVMAPDPDESVLQIYATYLLLAQYQADGPPAPLPVYWTRTGRLSLRHGCN